MSALPIYSDMNIRFVKPPPGYCVIFKRNDVYFYIYAHNQKYLLHMKNGKYGEYVTREKEYDTINDFLVEHQLECIPVETTKAPVWATYGHVDTMYLVRINTPEGKLMLIRITEEDQDESVTLYRAGGEQWVLGNPYLVFDSEEKMLKFIDSLNKLEILDN
jgi:hypothetical protein